MHNFLKAGFFFYSFWHRKLFTNQLLIYSVFKDKGLSQKPFEVSEKNPMDFKELWISP